jgi:hypothetical protein
MPTTVTKTIGSGRDYSTIQAWVDAAPADLTSVDQIWKGVLYKEGAGTNGEWTLSAKVTCYGSNHVTDATRYMWLTTASGASFTDNANKLTNALSYNTANGVAIRMTGTDRVFEFGNGITFRFTGLQIKGNTGISIYAFNTGGLITVENSIVCSADSTVLTTVPVLQAVNSVFYNTGTVLDFPSTARQYLYNSTIYSTSTSTSLLSTTNGDANIYDCAFFGGNAVASASTFFVGSNNATNQSSVGFGSSNQVSLTTANQFTLLTAGSEDFRTKAGAALINNGIRQQTYTNDLDIVGQARSITTPTIGAWEYISITYTYARPASDITTQWTPSTGTSHFAMIDEVTASDADYIFATAAAQTDEVRLGSMTTPNAGTSVNINYRVQNLSGGASVTTSLYCNTTLIKADTARTANGTYTMTVSSAEWASVADWTNMRIRFVSA